MAIDIRDKLSKQLAEYGFNLRKWKSNDQRILNGIDENDREASIDFGSTFKTLGIAWQATTDEFVFNSLNINTKTVWTKRKVLSAIAKLFDPLGWITPCIVRAKVLMQDIWRLPNGVTWDSELPNHIVEQWNGMVDELVAPIPTKVPRWLRFSSKLSKFTYFAMLQIKLTAAVCMCVSYTTITEYHAIW